MPGEVNAVKDRPNTTTGQGGSALLSLVIALLMVVRPEPAVSSQEDEAPAKVIAMRPMAVPPTEDSGNVEAWPTCLDPYLRTASVGAEECGPVADDEVGPVPIAMVDPEPMTGPLIGDDTSSEADAAAETIPDTQKDRWHVEVTPYIWLADIISKTNFRGIRTEEKLTVSQLSHDFRVAAMASARFYNRKWVVMLDGLYLNYVNDIGTSTDGTEVNVTDGFLTLAVGRRWDTPLPFEIFTGARYNISKARIDVGETATDMYKDREWVDPIVGGRLSIPLGKKWSIDMTGNVGGRAIHSNVSWEMLGQVSYQVFKHGYAEVGYRAMWTHNDRDDAELDYLSHGPIIGFRFKF